MLWTPRSLRRSADVTQPAPSTSGARITRRSYALTIFTVLLIVVLVAAIKTEFLPDAGNIVFDWYQRLEPRAWDEEIPVRVVDIDNESLARIGQWPWPHSTIAEIVTRLARLNPAALAFDIVFAEPDGLSPEQLVRLLPSTPGRALMEEEIKERQSNDAILAEALAQSPVALGAILTQDDRTADFPSKFGMAAMGDDPARFLPRFTGAVVPLPILSSASSGLGALNWLPDRDQTVRRVPLLLAFGDQIVSSLSAEALRIAQGASTLIVRSSNASGQGAFGAHTGVNALKIGDIEIPTDPQGELRVRFTHSEPRRFIPAWKVLAGEVERGDIEGRIIVLGTTAAGLRDERATPVDASVAGTEIHAQAIEQIIAGSWLTRPDWSPGAELLLAVLLALALGAALPRLSALWGAIAAIASIALVLWSSRYEFANQGLLLDPTVPAFSVSLAYVCCVVWLYRAEQRQRKFVRDAFGRYVSPVVVDRLAANPLKLVLGGESRVLTIMFCDIRGFTTLSERLDAQALTHFMNEYLTPMTEAVLAHGGTIDKYIGDAVMAFWNAPLEDPDHANHAASAALKMMKALAALNETWNSRAYARGEKHQAVKIGIGLATGECCVGNLGSLHRFNYSVLGDDVNLASRLEAVTKVYQTDILASEPTRNFSTNLPWLEVDHVRVKGKTKSTRIFTLVDTETGRLDADFAAVAERHERILAAYRCGNFAAAATLAGEASCVSSQRLAGLYGFYERRCRKLLQSPPPDWDPITNLTEK